MNDLDYASKCQTLLWNDKAKMLWFKDGLIFFFIFVIKSVLMLVGFIDLWNEV